MSSSNPNTTEASRPSNRNSAPVPPKLENLQNSQSAKTATNPNRASSPVPGSPMASNSKQAAKIGPYVLGKTLGVGSTGRVKIATHIETGQKAAVKIIPKQSLKPKKDKNPENTDPNKDEAIINKKLEREIAIMKLIQHPSIMALYDVYESPDDLYLVLELVEGGELFDYLVKQGRLKEIEALEFFQQIIAGVDYCHKHLICHRDLKPENLLLDGSRRIKIADFGMASLQVTGKLLETSCGSPHYASPEIIRGVKYDGATADVWSCGVILYALLTGNLPFDDDNIRRLLQRVKAGVYVIPDYVPKDAADLIRRMLVVNPEKRITIAEIEKHPWFLKIPYKWKNGGDGPLRSPPSDEAIQPFRGDREDLDDDILNSLSILGYGTEDEIVKNLKSPERNYEKVFYWALKQRKNEFLEKYDNEYDDHSRSLHRRTGSRSSVFADKSSMIDLQTPSSPTSPVNRRSDMLSDDSQRRRTPSESKRKSYSPSPLSLQTHEAGQSVDEAREKALQALQGNRPSPNIEIPQFSVSSSAKAAMTTGKKATLVDQFKKQMSLDEGPAHTSMISLPSQTPATRASDASDAVTAPPELKLSLNTNVSASTPSLVVNPNWALQQQQQSNGNLNSPMSPAIGNSPKRSWFANLFQFKPESFVLYSTVSLEKTRQRIEEFLNEVGVQYQHSKDGVALKCKYDADGTLPPVKFRISLNYAEDDRIEIMSTQQQGTKDHTVRIYDLGALSTFQAFIDKFKSHI